MAHVMVSVMMRAMVIMPDGMLLAQLLHRPAERISVLRIAVLSSLDIGLALVTDPDRKSVV